MRTYFGVGIIIIYLLLLGFLSLNPWVRPDSHQFIGVITWDLLDHAAAYGLLSILILSLTKRRKWKFVIILPAVLVSSVLGIILEFAQLWFTSTRSFSWYDAYSNIFGAVIGAIVYWYIYRGICMRKHGLG